MHKRECPQSLAELLKSVVSAQDPRSHAFGATPAAHDVPVPRPGRDSADVRFPSHVHFNTPAPSKFHINHTNHKPEAEATPIQDNLRSIVACAGLPWTSPHHHGRTSSNLTISRTLQGEAHKAVGPLLGCSARPRKKCILWA